MKTFEKILAGIGVSGLIAISSMNSAFAQFFPSRPYTVKETIELIKEYKNSCGEEYDSNHIYLEGVYLAGRPFVIQVHDSRVIQFYNDRRFPRDRKQMKAARKSRSFNGLPFNTQCYLCLDAFLEEEIQKNNEKK